MSPALPPNQDKIEGEVRIGWRMGGLGMEVASQVAAGALLGWAFDSWQNTAPTGLLVGSVTGIVIGLWSLIRGALKLNALLERHYPTAGRGRPLEPDTSDGDVEINGDAS